MKVKLKCRTKVLDIRIEKITKGNVRFKLQVSYETHTRCLVS